MPGNKVMAIFGKFRGYESHDDPVDGVERNPQERDPRNRLDKRAEPFQADAYKKAFVKDRG
jgi:hypothetical protein